jgi:hypothetical protein
LAASEEALPMSRNRTVERATFVDLLDDLDAVDEHDIDLLVDALGLAGRRA